MALPLIIRAAVAEGVAAATEVSTLGIVHAALAGLFVCRQFDWRRLGPMLFPIARQLGVHDVHYAMVVVLSMGLGLFTPPLGVGYYAACAIGRVHPDAGMRPIVACMRALLVGVAPVAAVPWLSTGFL